MVSTPLQFNEQGKQAYQAGNFQAAADHFLEAEKSYKIDGDLLQAAEMANNRSVALLQAGNAAAALEASKDTNLVFAEAKDTLREGFALGNQAAALRELGQKKESLRLYKLSAEKLSDAGDKENLVIVQKTISALELESGHKIDAMSSMLDALRAKEKLTLREKILRKLYSIAAGFMPKP
jgi:tetratricopeptide (TPR) repeat protein